MSQPPPLPPRDPEVQGAIDKFACYVAKNGPGVEEMTRHNNFGNPRFAFLFGGDYAEYYRYRLVSEINQPTHLVQHQPPPQPPPSQQQQHQFFQAPPPAAPFHPHPPPPQQQQQQYGRPPPLMAQQVALPPPPPPPIVPLMNRPPQLIPQPPPSTSSAAPLPPPQLQLQEQIAALRKQIADSTANLKAQSDSLQRQRDKRVIGGWADGEERRIKGLLQQVQLNLEQLEPLINHMSQSGSKETISNAKHWIFDHCGTDRQREIILTYLLHRVRVKGAGEQLRLHILYLINEWAHYCQRKKLDSIRQMLSRYVPKLYAHAWEESSLKDKLERLARLWEESKAFDENCYKQLSNPSSVLAAEHAIISAEQALMAVEADREVAEAYAGFQKQHKDFEQHVLGKIAVLEGGGGQPRRSRFDRPSSSDGWTKPQSPPPPSAQPPPPTAKFSQEDLIPKCPYYELPAGMMVPLVAPEDCTFKPIPVKALRLPAPTPPSDRLLKQIELFYSAPTPNNPRDVDGWEEKGLIDYYKNKAEHRSKLEERLKKEGKFLEELITNRYTEPHSKEEEREKRTKRKRRRRSPSKSSNSSSSRSRSRSPSPPRRHSRRRRRSRSRSPSPLERRAGFGGGGEPIISTPLPPAPLNRESNKGAQLMAKMGWEGRGLGAKAQGIEEPIHPGEVRTRDTQYMGVGSNNSNDGADIYTEYRRQMSSSISAKFGALRKESGGGGGGGGKWG